MQGLTGSRWTTMVLLAAVGPIMACRSPKSADELAEDAWRGNGRERTVAIERLREMGYEGLDALLRLHSANADPAAISTVPVVSAVILNSTQPQEGSLEALEAAIDAVGAQKDCVYSRLYWYTDIEKAKIAAQAEKKPILSLRLLGNLTEDLSCANSRFFRTTLYPNAEVSKFLRENYILHWQTVRPAPKITIDFGNGRKIERTITGNSIHYVLDCQGRVVDAIPGLYGAKAFLAQLTEVQPFAKELGDDCGRSYPPRLREYHAKKSAESLDALLQEVEAAYASKLWASLLKFLGTSAGLEAMLTDDAWKQIAARHLDESALDAAASTVVVKFVPAEVAFQLTASKTVAENPMMRLIRNLTGTIALDTVKNEYVLHRKIHEHLASDPMAILAGVDGLNDWVYSEIFQTPLTDPWLGLSSPDVFTAVEEDGRVGAVVSGQ